MVVRNTGGTTLTVTNIQRPAGINVQPSAFSLSAGDSLVVMVTASGQTVSGGLHYLSNDPDEPAWNQNVYVNNSSFPQVGSMAPDFTLQGTDGGTYTLSNMRGHVVFLEFGGGW